MTRFVIMLNLGQTNNKNQNQPYNYIQKTQIKKIIIIFMKLKGRCLWFHRILKLISAFAYAIFFGKLYHLGKCSLREFCKKEPKQPKNEKCFLLIALKNTSDSIVSTLNAIFIFMKLKFFGKSYHLGKCRLRSGLNYLYNKLNFVL